MLSNSQAESVPLRRIGQPQDIAPLAVYLVSDEAAWVSGTVIHADGGSRISSGVVAYLKRVNAQLEADDEG